MLNVLSVREAVSQARSEGIVLSECALRRWIRNGDLPVRMAGKKALIYYPALVDFLQCKDGGDNQAPATAAESGGIRRLEARP